MKSSMTSASTGFTLKSRILCIFLLIVFLITSNTLSICAISDQISEGIAHARASTSASMSASVRMPTANGTSNGNFPHALEDAPISEAPLMQEITTPESDSSVQQTAPDSKKRVVFRYAPAEDEARLRWLCEQFPFYSMCPQEKYYVLWEFLELKREELADIHASFALLQEQGYSLYDSTLLLRICANEIFTLDEAKTIAALYPQTARRTAELYRFATLYTQLNRKPGNSPVPEKWEHMQSSTDRAKQYFLSGYPTRNIQAALHVEKKLGISADALITKESNTNPSSEVFTSDIRALLTLYPVNVEPLLAFQTAQSTQVLNNFDEITSLLTQTVEQTQQAHVSSSGTAETNRPSWANNAEAPFTINLSKDDTVSMSTGSSYFHDNLISIPGRGGFDLNLAIIYNSATANLIRPKLTYYYDEVISGYTVYEYVECIDPDGDVRWSEINDHGNYDNLDDACAALEGYSDYSEPGEDGTWIYHSFSVADGVESILTSCEVTTSINDAAAALAAGWSWDLPVMEFSTYENESGEEEKLPASIDIPDQGRYLLDVYRNGDTYREWSVSTSQVAGAFGAMTRYATEAAFSEQDTFSNGTDYAKYVLSLVTNGCSYYFREDGKYIGTRDAYGNTIKYKYDLSGRLSQIIDTANRNITFTYANAGSTRTLTITLPDQQTIVLTFSLFEGSIYALNRIRRQNGAETAFAYQRTTSNTVYRSGEYDDYGNEIGNGSAAIPYALLNEVSYPTGAKLSYTYTASNEEGSEIIQQLWRVSQCLLSSSGGSTMQRQRYSYTRSYITAADSDYSAKVLFDDNSYHNYWFDKNKLLTGKYEYLSDGSRWYGVSYTYYAPGMLTSRRNTFYGMDQSIVGPLETWTRDDKGRVVQYKNAFGEVTTYSPTWMPYPYMVTQTTPEGSLTVIQNGQYRLTKRAEYIGDYQEGIEIGVGARAYTTQSVDAYGNITAEKRYLTMPTDTYTDGTYQQVEYVYGSCAGNSTPGLYLTGIKYGRVLTESYSYDIMGRLLSVTDGEGGTTTTTYDSMGRVASVSYPDGGSESYIRNDIANTVVHTTTNGGQLRYSYDQAGRLSSITRLSDNTVISAYQYDTVGRVTEERNAQNLDSSARIVYTYDGKDEYSGKKVYNSSNTLVYEEAVTWANQKRTRAIPEVGGETAYVEEGYTRNVQLSSEREYTSNAGLNSKKSTSYTRDVWGNVIVQQANRPNLPQRIDYAYDYANRLIKTTDTLGNYSTITYDAAGNKIAERDFSGTVTTYTYDAQGRLTAQSTPVNAQSAAKKEYTYDNAGRVILEKQSRNADNSSTVTWRTTAYAYDSMGRVTDVYIPGKQVGAEHTHYVYDTAGNLTKAYTGSLTSVSAPSYTDYALVQYSYDSYGNKTGTTDALGRSESYSYDANGKLISESTRDGRTISYTYDALGRETARSVRVNGVVQSTRTTAYDRMGRVISVSENGHTITNTYRNHNLVSVAETGNTTKSYSYDRAGCKTGYTLTVGGVVKDSATYTYDTMRRLSSVTSGGLTTSYTYDAAGRRLSETSTATGVNKSTTYTYNLAGLLTGMTNKSGGSTISSYAYTYYTDGSQRTKSENGVQTSYTYDHAGRLTSETAPASSVSYTYDARGNRTAMAKDGVATSYTYNKANQLLTETSQGTTKTYAYDNSGNLLTVKSGVNTLKSYTYDAWGRQTGYAEPQNLVTASYTYGADGLRKSKTVGGTTTTFVWDGANLVYESSGTVYTYGATLIKSSNGSATYIYIFNGHGDVVQLLAGTSVVKSYSYDAFGNQVGINAADTNPFRYCGEYYDKESGTIYLRARYYSPATGRFTQQDDWAFADPSQPLSLNLYTYCWNNPLTFVDYSGNFVISTTVLCLLGGAALLGTIGGVGGYHVAKHNEVEQKDVWKYVVGGAVIGAGVGALGGYAVGPAVAAATGIGGLSITGAGISTIAATSPWVLDQFTRGQVIEKMLGGWGNNFPVIDKVGKIVNGFHESVTSIKSIDLSAKTYQMGNNLYNLIMRYSDKLANFSTTTHNNFTAYVNPATKKILEIAVPYNPKSIQLEQINRAIEEAGKKGIEIIFRVIK